MSTPPVITLRSAEDASANFVLAQAGGTTEARYVRRREEVAICYLSAQTGCAKGCRFCHLTQTRQTRDTDVSVEDLLAQADRVLAHYDAECARGIPPAQTLHYNFMARGEVFASAVVRDQADALFGALIARARARGLAAAIKCSTIMPRELRGVSLCELFGGIPVDVYYSLYSTDPEVRRRWLPNALPVEEALEALVAYQALTRKIPVLHWAFIAGVNDDPATIAGIIAAVRAHGLRVDVNIVRYNPFSAAQGAEPPREVIERNARLLEDGLPGTRVQIVPRVGFDVKASCGMFVAQAA